MENFQRVTAFPSRARLIFALLVLLRPHYTIWSLAQASGSIVKELQRFSLTCGEQFPPNILVHSRIFSIVLELILWFN